MNKFTASILIIFIIAVIGTSMCAYTVQQHEQAVILAFGEVVGDPITRPGLYFKLPWLEARKFDKRWLAWDGDPNQVTTLDKRYISIDVFARWRIVDPLIFLAKLRDEESAQGRLDDILDSATRNVIANHNLIEAIRSSNRTFLLSVEEQDGLMNESNKSGASEEVAAEEIPAPSIDTDSNESSTDSDSDTDSDTAELKKTRLVQKKELEKIIKMVPKDLNDKEDEMYQIAMGRQKLTDLIREKAAAKVKDMGIEIKDVRLKRIDYIPSVQKSVFDRMISERLKVAARLRSQGDGLSAEIIGRKDRELKKIRSQAYKQAEEIKGKADADAARIYADAYKTDPELYKFLKSLESYRKTMDDKTTLLLTTKSDYASYLKSQK
ncbi:MAG: protease modulator HflC [Deltaproteobacteria bacterium]|nr:protease modulator HflC [Deltaproteobacteria bacterium]